MINEVLMMSNVAQFLWEFKVDGLIRLMEGKHTGPINIGNPGYYKISNWLMFK